MKNSDQNTIEFDERCRWCGAPIYPSKINLYVYNLFSGNSGKPVKKGRWWHRETTAENSLHEPQPEILWRDGIE